MKKHVLISQKALPNAERACVFAYPASALAILRTHGFRGFHFLLFSVLFLSAQLVQAQSSLTAGSGNWNSPATWQGGIVPNGSNEVVINSGHTVTLVANTVTTNVVTVDGILQMAGFNFTTGSLLGGGTGSVRSSSGTPVFTVGSDNTTRSFNGTLGTGAFSLVKVGTGTLSLSLANTFTGNTSITNGVIRITNGGGLGTAGTVTISSGAALQLEGGIAFARPITINGTGVGGTGALVNNSGDNSVSSTLTLASATLLQSNSGTLTLNATTAIAGSTFNLTFGGSGNGSVTGIISGSGLFNKDGSGSWTLSGVNTFSGNKSIDEGLLIAQNNSALGASGSITVVSGASLGLAGGITFSRPVTVNGNGAGSNGALQNTSGNNTFSATLTLGSASRIESNSGILTMSAATAVNGAGQSLVVGGSQTVTISGIIGTGSGTLTKEEGGTLILSNANTFTGGTTINAGIINIRNANALGTSGAITVVNGATLQIQDNITFSRPTSIAGAGVSSGGAIRSISGTNIISGTITLTAASRINSDAGTCSLTAATAVTATNQTLSIGGAGNINANGTFAIGTGQLNKDGNGTLTMTVANTFTGNTNISAGTLLPTNMNAMGTSSTINITGSGTLALQGGVTFARPINLASAGNGNVGGIRNLSGNNTLSGNIAMTGNARINSDLNLLTLSVAGNFTGTNQALTLGGAGSITFNRAITTTTGTVTKADAGTVTLNVPCTYTGVTTVSAGTLIYGANNIVATGNLTVTGGTLNIGAFSDTVNLFSVNGGTVSGTGTIYSIQDYSFSGTATININLGGSAGLLKIGGGTTTLTGANTFTGRVWIQNGTLSVASLNNVVAGSPSSNLGAPTTVADGTIQFGQAANDGILLYTGTGQSCDRRFELVGGNTGDGTITNNGSGALVLSGDLISAATGTSTFFLRGTNTGNNIFSGEIQENTGLGTTAFSKQDAGTWILTRSNGYFGSSTVGGGVLRLRADGALGQGTLITITGNTTSLELAPTAGTINLLQNITLEGSFASGAIRNINGNNEIRGIVSLTNTTRVNSDADTLRFTATPISIRSSNDVTARALTLGGAGHHVVIGQLNNGTTGAFTKDGAGAMRLYGTRSSGSTTLTTAGCRLILMASDLLPLDIITVNTGATLDLNSFNVSVGRLAGAGTVTSNVSGVCTLTVNNSSGTTASYSGLINDGSGTLHFQKLGSTTQTLTSTASNYTGTTYIEGGELIVDALTNYAANSSIGRGLASQPITINGGTLTYSSTTSRSTNRLIQLNGNATLNQINSGTITYTGTLTGTNRNLTLLANSTRIGTYNGIISLGTGSITKSNAGIWILGAANVYTGSTTINTGELRIGNAGAIPTSSPVVNNALLNLNGFSVTMSSLTGTDTTAEVRSNVAGAVTVTFSNTTGDFTYMGRILNGSGTLSIVKGGAYTQRLGGNNTYTGTTTINGGVFKAVSALAISSASAFTVANVAGATLDIQGFNNSIGSLAGGGTTGGNVLLGTATLVLGANNSSTTYAGTITGVGTGGIQKTGSGVFTFSGTADYTGLTIVAAGVLRAGADLEFPGVVSINTGADFNCNGFQSSCFYLSFNALRQASGSWGATISAAVNKNDVFFISSTGILVAIDGIANGYWLGTTSTNWFTTTNWHNGHVPRDTTRAVIEYVAINAPTINGTATCNNLEIFPAATVTMTGSSVIDVHGDWLNYGSFVPATSTVNFRKASGVAQVITRPSVGPFANLQYFGTGTLRLSSNEPRPFEMTGALLTNTGNTIDLNGKGLICAGLGGPGLITNSQPFDVTIAINGTTDRIFTGIIQNGSGTVAVTKAGTMSQAFEGANTFSGGITATGGTLVARNNIAALGTGPVTLAGTTPTLSLSNTAGVGLDFGNAIIVNAPATISSDNNTMGAGASHTLGTLTINTTALTVNGGTNVNSGIASIIFGAVSHSISPTYTVTNPVGGGLTELSLGALTGGTLQVIMAGNGNIVQTGAFNIQPTLATQSAITYQGTGILTLSQANTMTQRLTLTSGLVVGTANASALGTGTTVYMSGGVLSLSNNTPLAFNNPVISTINPTFISDRTTAGAGQTHTLGNYSSTTGTVDSMRVRVGSNVTSGIAGVAFGTLIHPATTNINVDTLALLQTTGFAGTTRIIRKYGGGEFSITGNSTRTSATELHAGSIRLGSTNSMGTSATGVFSIFGGQLILAADANTTFNNTDVLLRATTQPIIIDRATPGAGSVTHIINELVWNANNLELQVARGSNITGAGVGTLGINLLQQNTGSRTYNYNIQTNAAVEWPNYTINNTAIVINNRGAGQLGQRSGSSLVTDASTTINQLGSGGISFSGTNSLQGPVNIDSGEVRVATNTQTFRTLNINNVGRFNPGTQLAFALSMFFDGVRQSPRLYGSTSSTAQFQSDARFTGGSTGRLGLKGYLEFITQPIGGRSSLLFASPPVVQLRDSLGVLINNSDNTSPVLAFLSVTDAGNRGRLRGDSVELMVNDRATFDSLRIGGRADSIYRIAFIVDSLVTPALESDNISVTPGPIDPGLSSVIFSVDTAIANGVDSVLVTVSLSDIDTNLITNQLVSLTQDSGKASVITAENFGFSNSFGIAQFSVRSTVADSINYFAVTQIIGDDPFQGSARVYFIPGPPFRILVNNPPYSAPVNTIFFPAIEVSIFDSNDNRMWTDTNVVTLSLLPFGVIDGISSATEVSGVVDFPIVSIPDGGSYFMRAAVGSIADTSLQFDIIDNFYSGGFGDGHDANIPRVTNLDGKFVLQLDGSFVAFDKLYDGTTNITASGVSANNITLVGLDSAFTNVTLDTVFYGFLSPGVGENKRVVISEAELTGADTSEYIFSLFGAPFGSAKILGQSYFGGDGRGDILSQSDTLFIDGVKAVPSKLVFNNQPGDQIANEPFSLSARILSADDRLVPFGADQAVLDLFNNPSGASINGNTAPFNGGVAVFDQASVTREGNGYTLSLDASGATHALDTAVSTPFDVYIVYDGGRGRGDSSIGLASLGLDGIRYDVWIGGAPGNPRNWYTAANWNTGITPRDTSRILIPLRPNQPTLNRSAVPSENSFVLGSIGKLILVNGSVLTIDSGTVSANGPLFKLSSGSETETRGPNSKIVVEPFARYVNLSSSFPRLESRQRLSGFKGWRQLGSPVKTTYADFLDSLETQGYPGAKFDSLQPNVLWFAETDTGTTLQSWRKPANASDSTVQGRGHFVYVFDGAGYPARVSGGGNYADTLPVVLTSTGFEPNLTTGDFVFPELTFTPRALSTQADTAGGNTFFLDENVADAGWNLLANPTPSVLNWDAAGAWTSNNLDNTFYIWDPSFGGGTGGYRYWNGTVGNLDTSLSNGNIAPYQAFWIHANAASPSLAFNNDAKIDSSARYYSRQQAPPSIGFTVEGEGMKANSYVSFTQQGITGPDIYDAYQLESYNDNWLMLYTQSSTRHKKPLVINHLPDLLSNELAIPMQLAAARNRQPISGNYTIFWNLTPNWPANWTVALMDHKKELVVPMLERNSYQFSYDAPASPAFRTAQEDGDFRTPKAVLHGEKPDLTENPVFRQQREPQRPFTIVIIPNHDGSEIVYRPDHPYLYPPMPNPFEQETTLAFYLPEESMVIVEVSDMFGRVVSRQPQQLYTAGTHELVWNAPQATPGTYVIRLITADFVSTQKAVKIK